MHSPRESASPVSLPIERLLETPEHPHGDSIGSSRDGRPILGHAVGRGETRLSLIGGCHADEPVGPMMLRRLVTCLRSLDRDDPLLVRYRWIVVPHANPDGAERNRIWSEQLVPATDYRRKPDVAFDFGSYVTSVVREPPGEDIEFGFPRNAGDSGARPENRAVAAFLQEYGPYHLHGSFHGMAYAPGPWFLLDRAWIDRTPAMRQRLRREVRRMGYRLLDWDRRGDKGFERIDEGFSTRPDSRAMARYFLDRGDPATAALFRPSSMEYVRSLGGDPLTFVSEMPLFLHPDADVLDAGRETFRGRLARLAETRDVDWQKEAAALGLRPMPLRDQMRLQLRLLDEALAVVAAQ